MQLSLLSGRIFVLLKQNILPFISFSESHFSQVFRKKKLLLYSEYPGRFGGSLFFRLDMFYLVSFLLACMVFTVLGKHLLLHQRNMFYHFLCFCELAFASLHIYFLRVFVLITYLQCNIFICLRYLWRTIFLRLNNMFFRTAFVSDKCHFALIVFFHTPFVSDTWEESCYFGLIICLPVFYLSQIPE